MNPGYDRSGHALEARSPRPGTPFFGRQRSLLQVRQLLMDHPLVTITAVGGGGKTRLALEAATEAARSSLATAVGWTELAPLTDPRRVPPTVCASLGIRLAPEVTPEDALVHLLRSERWLLVLDNCEHVAEACAELVSTLIARCSELRILATSREALRLPGEALLRLPPLTLPDRKRGESLGVDEALRAPAIQLFVNRAQSVRGDFELLPSNVEAVAGLCSQLDGIPLALELAAAQVRVLSVQQISSRLADGLDVLRGSGRQVPDRHLTMRAALQVSHDLLSEAEQILFRRLGMFRGSFGIDHCESVCAGEMVDRSAVLELLTGLVDKSMVVADPHGVAAHYRLLEPVRRFAWERLWGSQEHAELRRRHLTYHLELAQTLAPTLQGPGRGRALEELALAHDDLRVAWDHALEMGDVAALRELARALFWFWNFAGHFDEGRQRSEEALEHLSASKDPLAELRHAAGALAWMQGDYEAAHCRLAACRAECEGGASPELLPLALRELAGVHLARGELTLVVQACEEALAHLHGSNRGWDRALALTLLADAKEGLGDGVSAQTLREDAESLFREAGDPWGLALSHFGLAVGAARGGDLDAARARALEALRLQRSSGDSWNVAQCLVLLGEIEERAKQPEKAAEHLLESLAELQAVGDRGSAIHVLAELAEVARQRGLPSRAVRLVAAADTHRSAVGVSYPYALSGEERRSEIVSALKREVSREVFAREWAAGAILTLDEAVAFALEHPEPARAEGPGLAIGGGAAALEVLALGPPEVLRDGRRLKAADWTYALPKELLFWLLVHGPRTKEQIGLAFWPDASPDQLRGRFRTTLYHLRRALGGREWVLHRDGRYELNREMDLRFDLEEFEADVEAGQELLTSDPGAAADRLQRAIDLYRGELMEGSSAAWIFDHRERLRNRYVDAVVALAGQRAAEGDDERAIDLYRRALAQDDLDERPHRGLAHSLARAGNRVGALRQLDELERLLLEELDAEPSAETKALRVRLERDPSS